MIEYGIESVYDTTLKRINRGHDYAVTQKTIEKHTVMAFHAEGI